MFHERLEDFTATIHSCQYTTPDTALDHKEALQYAVELLIRTRERGGIVYVVGNGGSAGIASHFHTDLVKALKIPSQTLYDTNLMTCLSNDYGYEHVFSSPIKLMMTSRDLLVAISSSGKSPNILNAAASAREKGAEVFTLSGFGSNNPLRALGDLNFYLDSSEYGLVEMGHFFLLHTIIDYMQGHQSSIIDYIKRHQCTVKSNH